MRDIEAGQAIYATDAILDYPQSGEQFRGRAAISAQRAGHPADWHLTLLRIVGSGDLWVRECVITYDRVPTYSVSVMEFADDHVVHETQVLRRLLPCAGMADSTRGADAGQEHR